MSEPLNTPETAAAGPDRPELRKALREIVESGIAGVQLRVHDERGEWVGTAGVRRLGDPGAPPVDGHYRIGSNTKTFTAVLVLQLVAEGRVGLDSPAASCLPEFGLDPRITVRMLLQHTSGVFNHTGEYGADGKVAAGIPSTISGREWVEGRFTTHRPEDLVRLALSKPARFEPGTGWSYSNTNYVLARLLVERVGGRSCAEQTQERIIGPLGLTGTIVPGTDPEVPAPHAHGYYRYEDASREVTVDVTRQNPSWISAGGDMVSTTRDLHRFVSALARGELLPAPLLSEMCTPHPESGFGLGIRVQETGAGGTVLFHNGGHSGHAALMYGTPDGRRTLTAGLNYVDDAALSLAGAFQTAQQRLVDAVFGSGRAVPQD
ncbi:MULTISPECIES: serine hydrolase domain-containing protein [Streptomyces]|uniref:serine hydrolase domain-containing protein n=1 Tax=Streptomyces TaxID=1883 RepID=UPI00167642F4|nr:MULTISPECIES: serine hydrolase domain-containing protein [Streptomyces]MBD3579282.1 beta-lactamase family protein [Streptomyces sp. KD18]GGT03246.1 serine hydrolase [Streptomyces toxytricini]